MTSTRIKTCYECCEDYPMTEEYWYKHRDTKGGFSHLCKKCHKEKYSKKKSANREQQARPKQSQEEKREYNRQWLKNHPEKQREYRRRRRVRKYGAIGSHTAAEVRTLYEQQDGKCFHCGADFDEVDYHEDHWIPLSRGGSDYITNIRLLCVPCNLSKNAKLPHEWDSRYTE